jgi:hypothetical protein
MAGVSCTDPDGGDYSVRGTTTGTNGIFYDSCDASGNLVEHYCEYQNCLPLQDRAAPYPTGGAGGIGIPCSPQVTGRVISGTVDCGGRCVEGACSWFCAAQGDVYSVVSTQPGMAVLAHPAGRILECTVLVELGGFNCSAAGLAGHAMTVVALGSCTPHSTTIGVDDASTMAGQDCTYQCTVTENQG